MDCETVGELAGAYALDALPDEERAAVVEHLRTCVRGHPELAELARVATLLPLAVEQREPPVSLRDRLLAQIQAEAAASPEPAAPLAPAEAGAPTPLPSRPTEPATPRGSGKLVQLWPWRLAVVALLVLSLGLGAWTVVLQGRLRDTEAQLAQVYTVRGTAKAPNVTGQVIYFKQVNAGLLVVEGLPPLDPSQTYQVWLIQGNNPPQPAGFVTVQGTRGQTAVQGNLATANTIAVSIEQAGGVQQPTVENIVLTGQV